MTSIRGRRVHRSLMREFARFDQVLPVTARMVVPRSSRWGTTAAPRYAAPTVAARRPRSPNGPRWRARRSRPPTTSYDLLKDSLPIVAWTLWHPSFDRAAGALTISGADLAPADRARVAEVLRRLGR